MKITVILPVSRTEYLDRVLESLTNQTYKPNNLIVIFDGYDSQYLYARNKIVEVKLDNVICVPSNNPAPAISIPDRRNHIVAIHNQIRELIEDCDWIFAIEDDGILPPDALEKLVNHVEKHEDTGMVSGVELGRWGVPYVGAWTVDNIYDTHVVTSAENKTHSDEVEEIDACGLYCALIRADYYKLHEFYTMNGLGPDVNLGLYLRQQGFKNYIDWSIHVTHITFNNGLEVEIPATSESRVVSLQLLSGSTWKH